MNEAGRLSQVRLDQGKNLSGDDTGQLNGKSEEKCFPDRRTRICKNPERKDKVCMTGKEEHKGMNVRRGKGDSHTVIRSCETLLSREPKQIYKNSFGYRSRNCTDQENECVLNESL